MAKINFYLGDIVGKLAGLVFQGGPAGAIIRSKGTAKQSMTEIQSVKRAVFAVLGRLWAYTLTQEQRTEWNALAASETAKNAFGASYDLSGYNIFQRLNVNLDTAGYSFIEDAPADLDVTGLTGVVIAEIEPDVYYGILEVDPVLPVGHVTVVKTLCNASPALTSVEGLLKNTDVNSEVGLPQQEFECLPSGAPFVLDRAVWVKVHFLNTVNGVLSAGVLVRGISVVIPP